VEWTKVSEKVGKREAGLRFNLVWLFIKGVNEFRSQPSGIFVSAFRFMAMGRKAGHPVTAFGGDGW
jgi:hypothetical protein